MARVLSFFLLAGAAFASPGHSEAEILDRWDQAGPEERRRLGLELAQLRDARRFSDARPILVRFDGQVTTIEALFRGVLEPALEVPLAPKNANDLGLTGEHRRALAALVTLREAFDPPVPVHAGTLNLWMEFAHRALTAPALSADGRLRFLGEVLRNVRALEGRVEPDRRTRWILRQHLLPALVGLARRMARNPGVQEAIAEAASLLYMPSILDDASQRLLVPLTRGTESRRILLRAYRHGTLDEMGVVALARSVVARTRDDAAYAAGAPSLILELLTDPLVAARERGALVDAAMAQLISMRPFWPSLRDLCAAAFGGAPVPLDTYVLRRTEQEHAPLAAPEGKRVFRFLQVLLVQSRRGEPPTIARVVREDTVFYKPLYQRDRDGGRGFVGILAPAPGGEQADFLGPPPGVAGRKDLRLLRRRLELERISIKTFGALGEYIELCAALPEDSSEPVPERGARLTHLLALIEARLQRSAEEAEIADLIRLLVRVDTPAARDIATRQARMPAGVAALLPLAERGHKPAAIVLLEQITALPHVQRERAFAGALRTGVVEPVRALCLHADVSVAVLAGDALLGAGDIEGVKRLLLHKDLYARAAGTSLALRLTPMAGSLRITPEDAGAIEAIAGLCLTAFSKKDSEAWTRYGAWLADALKQPDRVRKRRGEFKSIPMGGRQLSPAQFADWCIAILADPKYKESWAAIPPYLLSPIQPGRGMGAAALKRVLDAVERRLAHKPLARAWRDALVVLACVQHGIEVDARFLDVAHARLTKLAGRDAPKDARRKPGVYWPIWAAGH